jgi:hypothetical protein
MTDTVGTAEGHTPRYEFVGRTLRKFHGNIFTVILQTDPDISVSTEHKQMIESAVNERPKLLAKLERYEKALARIEKWLGEFPETGKLWDNGAPMSYSAAYGSNGERDYMRSVARAALQPEQETP